MKTEPIILDFNEECFDETCTIAFCESISKLEDGIWMRLILGGIQITYGTIIYIFAYG